MKPINFISILLAASSLTDEVLAAGSVCSNGIYAVLAPLSNYPPAQSYCASRYPASTVTVSKRAPVATTTAKTTAKATTKTTAYDQANHLNQQNAHNIVKDHKCSRSLCFTLVECTGTSKFDYLHALFMFQPS